jgi:hypothetical protein
VDKDQLNAKFDIAFHNALRHSYEQIKLPEDHVILESWKVIRSKLESYCNENQGIEK